LNYILDINIIIDYFNNRRREQFPSSVETFNYCYENNANIFLSSSSLDNIAFLKIKELKEEKGYSTKKSKELVSEIINFLINKFKIAKTPSYIDIDIDYEDIEDSQIIASAKAVNAKVITRDKGMLKKYSNIAITPKHFLDNIDNEKNIDFANLNKQYFMYQSELEEAIDRVLNNSSYIMGSAVKDLEKNLQTFTGVKHAITCSSGTDALLLAMMALDIEPDDEIITTPFTFIATAETIAFLKAKPVFVDIDDKTYNIDPSKIEAKITKKTKAIMPVSLYGQPADMEAIQVIADKYNLKVIVDGAQSFGSTFNGKTDSNLGDISTTSFFPAKPLGCFGDGGTVFTNDDVLAEKMKSLRVHGQSKRYHHQYIGMGGRMDTLQCTIVDVKLKYYAKDLALRQEVASKYTKLLKGKNIILPFVDERATSVFAQYSIRVKNRDAVQTQLKKQGIPTAVHYPMPLHLQECFSYLGYKKGDFLICEQVSNEIMSLPMNPYLSDVEIAYISTKL
jgi:UDP-2-acetamido-2-deoxy-ribo-hexuluronate aminotransferase